MGLTFLGWANNVGSAAFAGPSLYLLVSVGLASFVTSMKNSFKPIPIAIENVEVVLFIRKLFFKNWNVIITKFE